WRTAERFVARIIEVTPGDANAHNALGEIAASRGDGATAEREFRAAAALNPQFVLPPRNLARLYAGEGKPREAIEAYHELLRRAERSAGGARPEYRQFLVDDLVPIAEHANHLAD